MKFFRCPICGYVLTPLSHAKGHLVCCGKPMEELIPGATDGAAEKHVPQVKVEGSRVLANVGSVMHPMSQEHQIQWILLETDQGHQVKTLSHTQQPAAEFVLSQDEKPLAVYEYCNLHGLWKKDLD